MPSTSFYMTSGETKVVQNALTYVRRNFPYLSDAYWFPGWDSFPMRDAAIRCYIADRFRIGDKAEVDYHTVLAKFHANIDPKTRLVVVTSIPTVRIGGSISRIGRVYRDNHYHYAGAWNNMQNEIIAASLANAHSVAAPVSVEAFNGFVADVRKQMEKKTLGVCRCGVRQSNTTCDICGKRGA